MPCWENTHHNPCLVLISKLQHVPPVRAIQYPHANPPTPPPTPAPNPPTHTTGWQEGDRHKNNVSTPKLRLEIKNHFKVFQPSVSRQNLFFVCFYFSFQSERRMSTAPGGQCRKCNWNLAYWNTELIPARNLKSTDFSLHTRTHPPSIPILLPPNPWRCWAVGGDSGENEDCHWGWNQRRTSAAL